MPVSWLREPLGAIICGDPNGDGLKLAVMARPCDLKQPRRSLSPQLVAQLEAMTTSPRPYGSDRAEYSRCSTLRSLGFVANRGTLWWVTPAGTAWLAAGPVDRFDLDAPTVAALRGGPLRCRDIARRLQRPTAELGKVLQRLARRGVVVYNEATGWSVL